VRAAPQAAALTATCIMTMVDCSLGGAMSELATYELILAGYAVTRHIHFGTPR